ncbi:MULTISPECIES: hypothetical protein [Sphingobium]|uniref:hypothetical protein n=1 Tax=Sphingobium TaxID=165695 RepID=UPI0017C5A5A7|nr:MULTISPECIES: hypothetical protein [Sphingobium]MCW2363127.1 hypothetical protein [Sphingobium sp. B10D3B]MCW2368277.1 hypothetical protein [Sphingobium sp. B11D3D]MCW2400193.1 hypothetical protein [Sphingobium sp. B10D7B]MCW2407171.1 hypothetical protein [Sphingobium xanthum]MCW2413344.1 hypothetical protein [Sphingobium sp. B8D3D]
MSANVMARNGGAKASVSWAQAVRTANRFAAAILGGYLFAYGFTALATFIGFGLGLPFSEAQVLAWMLGALVYLGAMLWGFVPRTAATAWAVLAGGGAAMGSAAWALSRLTV